MSIVTFCEFSAPVISQSSLILVAHRGNPTALCTSNFRLMRGWRRRFIGFLVSSIIIVFLKPTRYVANRARLCLPVRDTRVEYVNLVRGKIVYDLSFSLSEEVNAEADWVCLGSAEL